MMNSGRGSGCWTELVAQPVWDLVRSPGRSCRHRSRSAGVKISSAGRGQACVGSWRSFPLTEMLPRWLLLPAVVGSAWRLCVAAVLEKWISSALDG